MRLYYMPQACSLAVQIALHELEMPYDAVLVDAKTRTLPDGSDYRALHPRGQVPLLELDDGTRLAEGPVITQYLADRQPGSTLMPAAGTMDRYRELEWLNYLTSELHQRFYPLFKFDAFPDDVRATLRADLEAKLAYVDERLGDRTWLLGDAFTLADGYLFTMLRWTRFVGVALDPWPRLAAYRDRAAARPAVHAAMTRAGVIKA